MNNTLYADTVPYNKFTAVWFRGFWDNPLQE